MYNRYIPSSDGTYQRKIVQSSTEVPKAEKPPAKAEQVAATIQPSCPAPNQKSKLSFPQLDTGDILVLLILLLILIEGEDADPLSVLITLGVFLFLQ